MLVMFKKTITLEHLHKNHFNKVRRSFPLYIGKMEKVYFVLYLYSNVYQYKREGVKLKTNPNLKQIIQNFFLGMYSFSRDVKLMIGKGIPRLLKVCICVVTPIILLVSSVSFLIFHLYMQGISFAISST